MASPLRSEVHVNRPLGQIAIATIQEEKDFIASRVFPSIAVQKQSDRYIVYNRDDWFRTIAQKRAPATESVGSGFNIDNTPNYFCDKYAAHMDVAEELLVNCDDPIDISRDATAFVTRQLLLRREKIFAGRYLAPNVWGGFGATNANGVYEVTDFTPSKKWSDDRSNPMADVAKLMTEMKRNTSLTANKMVVTHDVNEALKQHALVLDRIKYTETAIATEDLLARLFNVDEYIVSSAVENSAQEGQTGQYDFINAGKVLLVHTAPRPGLMIPSAGYIFSWAGMFGASAMGTRVKTIPLPLHEAERVEAEMAFDMHQIAADLGIFSNSVL